MTAPAPHPYPPGTAVWVDVAGHWQRGRVVPLHHPQRYGWWPGVDFRRAVAVRLDPGCGVTGAGRGPFDVLVPDPDSPMLRPRGPETAPRTTLLRAVRS